MRRRQFIATIAMGSVAGCTGREESSDDGTSSSGDGESSADDSSAEPTATPEPTPTPVSTPTSASLDAFENYMGSHGIDVQTLGSDGPLVEVTYVPHGQTDEALATEIGIISGGFFRGVEEGMEADRLDVTMVDREGRGLATWYAEVEWLEEHRRGELADDELSLRILETLTPIE